MPLRNIMSIFIRPFEKGDEEYEGEMKDGKRHGNGILLFSNGRKFEGEFRNGLIATGIYREKDNSIIARGDFIGNFNGWGRYRLDKNTVNGYPDGYDGYREYEGEFSDGVESGKGILKTTDGTGYSVSVIEGEFQHGMPGGYCVNTVSLPNGDVWIYKGEHGEYWASTGWTFLEGNVTLNNKVFYKNLKLYNHPNSSDWDYYQGFCEWEHGKFIGNFSHPYLEYEGQGILLEDDSITVGSWNKGVLIGESQEASIVIEDYTERADKVIQLRKNNPIQYAVEFKRLIEEINFVITNFKIQWPQHLPDNIIHLYKKSTHDEFVLVKERVLEIDRTYSEKKSRFIPQSVKNAVWRRDEGKCTKCGSNEKLEYDHIIPYSKGGPNTQRNLQLLCEACNRKKSDKM